MCKKNCDLSNVQQNCSGVQRNDLVETVGLQFAEEHFVLDDMKSDGLV